MSKVDAQRAMREAKYARSRASGPTRREAAAVEGTSTAPAARTPPPEPARAAEPAPTGIAPTGAAPTGAAPTGTASEGARCGHKSMNGRACTREAAHAEKNHRYS